jgi:hypothetical protein
VEAVVDRPAAAAALTQYLPVFELGDDVFDAGSDPAVSLVVVVADDPTVDSAARTGDRVDATVFAVAEDDTAIEQLGHGVAGHDDVVAVGGPAATNRDHVAALRANDDWGIDAAPVVLADGGGQLVVDRVLRQARSLGRSSRPLHRLRAGL